MLGLLALKPLLGAGFDLRPRLGQFGKPFLAPRLALACTLVPSSATVPSRKTPISPANFSTSTNSPSICFRNRRRKLAIVS